jgi:hypothetical protein
LLKALARIRDAFPVRLIIVGEGPLEASWKHETSVPGIQDIVTFCGPLSAVEVTAQKHAAHVFCLPSAREYGGDVLLKAMVAWC